MDDGDLSPQARRLAQEIARQHYIYGVQASWQSDQISAWVTLLITHTGILLGWPRRIVQFILYLGDGMDTVKFYGVLAGIFYLLMVVVARRTYLRSWIWAAVLWLVVRLWWNVVHIAEQPIWLWPIAVVTVLLVGLAGFGLTFPEIANQADRDLERFH